MVLPNLWIALSDHPALIGDVDPAVALPRGLFVLELMLPLAGPTVLFDHAMSDPQNGAAIGFSLFHDPERGLILLQRQNERLLRHPLAVPLTGDTGLVRITYQWDAPAKSSVLSADMMDGTPPHVIRNRDLMCWRSADLLSLCTAGLRHPSVLWFGFSTDIAAPSPRPWVGLRTPVDTPRGPVPAGLLRAGDIVSTVDGGPRALRAVQHLQVPGRGAFAPILLRAPYFGQTLDLLVSSEQAIALQGTSVEYLYGEDLVLARAGNLADGIAAYADNRRTVINGIVLDFGAPALFSADGGMFMAGPQTGQALPARLLHRFEVTPLLAMQQGSGFRPVA